MFPESIVEPNQQKYPWYHQQFRRVPTIDQCHTDDPICKYESDQQFKRDKKVDDEILSILRRRFEDCVLYEAPDHLVKCRDILDTYNKATENWFIKCMRDAPALCLWIEWDNMRTFNYFQMVIWVLMVIQSPPI